MKQKIIKTIFSSFIPKDELKRKGVTKQLGVSNIKTNRFISIFWEIYKKIYWTYDQRIDVKEVPLKTINLYLDIDFLLWCLKFFNINQVWREFIIY